MYVILLGYNKKDRAFMFFFIAIMLSRMKMSNEEIRLAIELLDGSKFNIEDLKTMQKNAPTSDEVLFFSSNCVLLILIIFFRLNFSKPFQMIPLLWGSQSNFS